MERFTYYKDYYEIIQRIKKTQDKANLSLAILEFIFEDKMPENCSDAVDMAFELLLPKLEKSKNNSGRGGRPKNKTDLRNGFQKTKPICETVSNRFQKNETDRKTVPYEKERSKEKDIPLEKEIKERKKEIDKDIISISACACEDDGEELKSHEDIMCEWNLSSDLTETLKNFLRHCYINGHVVSNAKLEDILLRLIETFGTDERAKIECVEKAVRGGYLDIKA